MCILLVVVLLPQGYRRVNFVPLHFDHTPERLETTGRSVVLEVSRLLINKDIKDLFLCV